MCAKNMSLENAKHFSLFAIGVKWSVDSGMFLLEKPTGLHTVLKPTGSSRFS